MDRVRTTTGLHEVRRAQRGVRRWQAYRGTGRIPSRVGPGRRPTAHVTNGRGSPEVPGVMPWGRLAEPRGGGTAAVLQRQALWRPSPFRSPRGWTVIAVDYPPPPGGGRLY